MNSNTGIIAKNSRGRFLSSRGIALIVCLLLGITTGWALHSSFHTTPPSDALSVMAFFSPGGGARQAILDNINEAQTEILVALYYFTDPGLADALIEGKNRGVDIRVILDRSQRKGKYSQAKRLTEAGIPVHFDSNHRIFHHKFMVVDERILITGSQNWTKSAEMMNAENIVQFRSSPELVTKFKTQFFDIIAFNKNDGTTNGNHTIGIF